MIKIEGIPTLAKVEEAILDQYAQLGRYDPVVWLSQTAYDTLVQDCRSLNRYGHGPALGGDELVMRVPCGEVKIKPIPTDPIKFALWSLDNKMREELGPAYGAPYTKIDYASTVNADGSVTISAVHRFDKAAFERDYPERA